MGPQPAKPEYLADLIHAIRGERVMLDADLAQLYGVEIRAVNQAVKRNTERFPEDFVYDFRAKKPRG